MCILCSETPLQGVTVYVFTASCRCLAMILLRRL